MNLFPKGTFFEGVLQMQNGQTGQITMSPKVEIEGRTYYNSITAINDQQQISADLNEITFLNNGSNIIVINNVLSLYPGTPGSVLGDSISFDGKEGEKDSTLYEISFSGAGVSNCIVIRKNYQ